MNSLMFLSPTKVRAAGKLDTRATCQQLRSYNMLIWAQHVRKGIIHSIDTKLAEWISAGGIATWGYMLYNHPGLVENNPVYSHLGNVLSQEALATLCMIVGVARIIILGVNGGFSRSPHLRTGASLISAMIWFQVAIAFVSTGVTPAALVMYFMPCISDYAAMLRAARDARVYDEVKKG